MQYVNGKIPQSFYRFASCVRVLNLCHALSVSSKSPGIAPHSLLLLETEIKGTSIFPSLCKISMQTLDNPTDQFTILPLIFRETVTTLELSGPGLAHSLFSTFCIPLAFRRMQPRHITLNGNMPIDPWLLNVVLKLVQLETLSLRFPNVARTVQKGVFIEAAQKLNHLTSLTIDLHFSDCGHDPPNAETIESNQLLPNLQTFHTTSRRDGGKLCNCIYSPLMRKMTVLTLVDNSRTIEGDDYFEPMMATLLLMPHLSDLEVSGSTPIMKMASILPFCSRLSLHTFRVTVPQVAHRHHTPLAPIIDACFSNSHHGKGRRLLRYLSLPASMVDSGNFTYYYKVNLECLSYVAKEAIGLERLDTGIDTSIPGGSLSRLLSRWKRGSPSKCTLRLLFIHDVRKPDNFNAQEYDNLAQLLDLMFPQLESIAPYKSPDAADAMYWKSHWWFIEKLRKMYKELRSRHG